MIKHWAHIVSLEKGLVLFTIRRDRNDPSKGQIAVEMDSGSFIDGATFGVAKLELGDFIFTNMDDDFLDTFATVERAEEAVKIMVTSWAELNKDKKH